MESPTTRSMRKRELEAMETGDVSWVHDQDLRKAVLLATENEPIAPPSPTQKPRAAFSRLATSPSSSPLLASSSSRPARKRPCRNHRSMPNTTKSRSSLPMVGSSSAPAIISSEAENLDALLARFWIGSTGKSAENTQISASGSGSGTHAHEPLSPIAVNRQYKQVRSQTPLRKSTTPHKPRNIDVNASPKKTQSAQQGLSKSTLMSGSARGDKVLLNSRTSSSASIGSNGKPASSSPRNIKGQAPRLGLRSSANTSYTKSTEQRSGTSNDSKCFKPPLLTNSAIRSSPRRAVALPISSKTDSTSSSAAVSRGVKRSHQSNVPVSRVAVGQPHPTSSPSGKIVVNSDSTGDESFDSFDGFLQGGGPEVEELFKAVDGTQ